MKRKLYHVLAAFIDAMESCRKTGNEEWLAKHHDTILSLVREHMPSGGGFDGGTILDLGASNGEKLVFITSYHHMNDTGMYVGWTHHKVIVRSSLTSDINLTISGPNRNDFKDYAYEAFHSALTIELIPDHDAGCYKRAA